MLRLQCLKSSLRRLLSSGTVNRDLLLEQLRVCSNEDSVFDVVGKNKAKLTVDHVGKAVEMLWQFQKEKPDLLRTVDLIKNHPQFLTLRVLAENKIVLMDDIMLVDTLYSFLRLNVDHHDSLIQQMMSEAWLRLDKFPFASLSKFAVCLEQQHLHKSPLMGQIANILAQNLQEIYDARILTPLAVCVSSMASSRLQHAIIARIDHLWDTMEPFHYNNPRRVLQFLCNIKHIHRPLIDKCNKIILKNTPIMNVEDFYLILNFNLKLEWRNCDFTLAAKQRLIELIDSSTDPFFFSKLFVSLCPLASPEIRERLESTAFLLADEFDAHQARDIAEGLEEIQSRNFSLMNKIAAVIQRNLHVFKPYDVARITQTLFLLQYKNPELYCRLRTIMTNFLQETVFPHHVAILTWGLSLLPFPRVDESLLARIEAVLPQCDLKDLSRISCGVAKWVQDDPSNHNTPSKYVRLLQAVSHHSQERLRAAEQLDPLLEELRFVFKELFVETGDLMGALHRMMDQINWTNVPELCRLLRRIDLLSPPLMEHIATVVVKDIDKCHYSAISETLKPFTLLNYDSVKTEDLYDACIQHVAPHISSFDPYSLVLLGLSLATVNRFPKEIIKEIFSVDFLGKLDSQLEVVRDHLNLRIRFKLMQLNRAVCLECPESQVPWFHQRYCELTLPKVSGIDGEVQKRIHKTLCEILGGLQYVRLGVLTPYFYMVDFECMLDKERKPLPYTEQPLESPNKGQVHWESKSNSSIAQELPPGAQRVAVEFLDSKHFCKNSRHIKGGALMRKRHLEILGYSVVQIPYFECNPMELSTKDAWKVYLQKKILGESSV